MSAGANLLLSVDFFVDQAVIAAVTSETTACPAENALAYLEPNVPWRATGNQQVDLTYDLAAPSQVGLMWVNRANYDQVQFLRSVAGTTYDDWSSNALLWSHKPRRTAGSGGAESPWSSTANMTLTPDAARGPDYNGPLAQLYAWTAVNTNLTQARSTGGFNLNSRPCVFSVWLKAAQAGLSGLTLSLISNSVTYGSVAVTPDLNWRRYSVGATIGASNSPSVSCRIAGQGASGSVYLGASQLTFDTASPLMGTYETWDLGMVIQQDDLVTDVNSLVLAAGRAKMAFETVAAVAPRYVRYRIPSQAPNDGSSTYQTGVVAPAAAPTRVPGLHQVPGGPETDMPVLDTPFPSGRREVLTTGDSRWMRSWRGDYRARDNNPLFRLLNRLPAGYPILAIENVWEPESPHDYVSFHRAYLSQKRSFRTTYQQTVPEVLTGYELALEELV